MDWHEGHGGIAGMKNADLWVPSAKKRFSICQLPLQLRRCQVPSDQHVAIR
jgi:hypothetical protein